ncbi:MAG: alpha/beta fold hydrolase [Cyanobacteriota bacterium]|nr:alpha/beta fold hydrolase [Cyanobacteriota bacterium]
MGNCLPPLVLVHGLWDTPRVFNRLLWELGGRRQPLLIPHLPHRLGAIGLLDLAEQLGRHIDEAFGPERPIDLLGFSMGGVIVRSWIQLLAGHRRSRRFFCVGSPQRGTLAAQLTPAILLRGIADMKRGSRLLRQLDADLSTLEPVSCRSYYCATDITVFPGWDARLPIGPATAMPVFTHRQLIVHPRALTLLSRDLTSG